MQIYSDARTPIEVLRYSHVMHIGSTVWGSLAKEMADAVHAL